MSRPKLRPVGRPVSITDENCRDICERIGSGSTVEQAAKAAGLSPRTVYIWLARGEEGEKPFDQFLRAFQMAKKHRLLALEERVSGAKDWRAAFELLKVLKPKEFAQRIQVHVEHELSGALARLQAEFADEPQVYERILAAIAGLTGVGGADAAAHGAHGADDRSSGQAVHAAPAEPPAT